MILGGKLIFRIIMMVVIIVGTIFAMLIWQTDSLINSLTEEQVEASNRALEFTIDSYKQDDITRAEVIAANSDVVEAIQNSDNQRLRQLLISMSDGLDLITLCDVNGIALARSHNEKMGDDVSNQQALTAALSTGNGISTIEGGTVVGISTRGSAAIFDAGGNIIGAVTCGHDLSQQKYVNEIKSQSNCEVTIFSGDVRLSSTLTDENGNSIAGTQADSAVTEAVINNRQQYKERITLFGRNYQVCYSPLVVGGEVVGMLFSAFDIENTLAQQSGMIRTLVIVTVFVTLLCLGACTEVAYRMIARPMKKILAYTKRIEAGDIGIASNQNAKIDVKGNDEIGQLARALENTREALRGYVGEIGYRMRDFAGGDFSADCNYPFQGDFILIKESINTISSSLNNTMMEISQSSHQMATGTRQISDGAQSLAAGANEQAASVSQLSSIVEEVAGAIKNDAEKAGIAADLGLNIKNSADKGSKQMNQMLAAVKEINDASLGIGKVIKVIDDIAFQTNILALNAAVEAARAGQHGKGFAVVAEEVRSLASKSAEAAKNTGSLIANSIEKADLGAKIAGETAESLAEIVKGINESSRIVTEIAHSFGKQNEAVSQINKSIDEISQIVQQNSSHAEESAASSEEMSSQSAILDEMVSQFKLKGQASGTKLLGGH